MKRIELEKFIGKHVKVTLYDGDEYTGDLHQRGEAIFKNNPNLNFKGSPYYLVTVHGTSQSKPFLFRSSHVKKISLWG